MCICFCVDTYRGEDFATMPKVQINITPFGAVHVFDGGKRLKDEDVTVTAVGNHPIVRLPLRLLGDRTPGPPVYGHAVQPRRGGADDTAWHLFSLSNGGGNGHTMCVKPTSVGD
jgi:hypothetical protein